MPQEKETNEETVKQEEVVEDAEGFNEDQGEVKETTKGQEEETQEEIDFKVSKQSYALLQLIQDPSTSKATITALASQLGLDVKERTKEEVRKEIADYVADLGEEFAFLGPKIDQLISKRLQKLTLEQREIEATNAQKAFYARHPEARKHEKGLIALMEELPPGKIDMSDYLEKIYSLYRSSQADAIEKEKERRIRQNQRERTLEKGSGSGAKFKQGPSSPTIRDAVAAAFRGEKFEE